MTQSDRLHLIGGACIALTLAALFLLLERIGPGLTLVVGSVAFGVGVEVYQRVRGEGEADFIDALLSAAPGCAAGLAWWGLA